MDLRSFIRDVPDFPKPGILFRDITPLLAHPDALRAAIDRLSSLFRDDRIGTVVGIESRGFILGAPVALRLGAGFVPVRKPGKLPSERLAREYALEYGNATVEIHRDALPRGERVLVVDDVIATGGTLEATAHLVRELGGDLVAAAVLIELTALDGRKRLKGLRTEALIKL